MPNLPLSLDPQKKLGNRSRSCLWFGTGASVSFLQYRPRTVQGIGNYLILGDHIYREEAHLMKPYYEHSGITIYHGHWMEFVANLPLVDLVLTDPPYGETSLDWDEAEIAWLDRKSTR